MKKQLSPAPVTEAAPASPRKFFYLTAAINGAAVMIIEILGAKMLNPYVGTSHFVWTAQIAVTLIALATGYYIGGWRADRSANVKWLYNGVFVAGAYLCFAVLIIEPVAYWSLQFRLAVGSLLASSVLFFLPLALLAMTGPFLIRVITVSVSSVGGNVGRLSAISTLGSVIGTVLIGYVLIPMLPNTRTMLITAFLLMAISAFYHFVWGKSAARISATSCLLLVAIGLGYPAWNKRLNKDENLNELYRANSNFGLLQVMQYEGSDRRYYLNDYLTQNTYDTNRHQSTSMFTFMLHELAKAYTTNIQQVLCIGLGVGIVPMEFANEGTKVDVVEINPAVVPLGQKYFDLQPEKLNITIGDGRYYVAQCKRQYDAIVLDAFLGESSPSHLMTKEAFANMRRILRPSGAIVINCFGDFAPGKDFFAASLEKTLKHVFGHVLIHNEHNGGNVFMVASASELQIHPPPSFEYVYSGCRNNVEEAFKRIVETDARHGIVLTDDYNPVEFYDARNREELRRLLANAMRE